jgi:hypothetical protein
MTQLIVRGDGGGPMAIEMPENQVAEIARVMRLMGLAVEIVDIGDET